MPLIRNTVFDGIMPRLAPKLLPPNCAQTAQNIDLSSKRLSPWKVPLLSQAIITGQKTIYKWRRNSSFEWLNWDYDVDVVQSPIAEDQYERIYFTGYGSPKVIGWDGSKVQRDMALPTASAPTAAATNYLSDAQVATWGLIKYATQGGGAITQPTLVNSERAGTQIIRKYRWTHIASLGTTVIVPQLTFGTLGNLPATQDGSFPSGTIALMDGGTQYGTLSVVSIDDVLISFSGQTGDTETWEATVTLDLGYVESATKYAYYVQTLVDDWGQEGPPSDVSNQVTWNPGQKVTVNGLGSAQGMTKRRLYRSAAGTSEDHFYFLTELNAGDSSFTDTISDAALGEELTLFENPPNDLAGIVMLPGGWAAAFHGREVCFSEPYYPWSWPTIYRVTVDYDVVGLGVAGNDLYVLTTGTPYLVTGYHPESLTVAKLTIPQSCVAKRSIAPMGNMICYASPDGLVGIAGGQAQLLTEKFYSRDNWQALTPTGMISAFHDDRYFGFCAGGGIICKFSEGTDTVTTTDQTVAGLFPDLIDDTLYMIQGANINAWNRGATNMTMTWRGKEFPVEYRVWFSSGRIVADGYPLILRIYQENVLVLTQTVSSNVAFRLPKLHVAICSYSLEVESVYAIDRVAIGSSMQGIRVA
jgi:hypothetical protein